MVSYLPIVEMGCLPSAEHHGGFLGQPGFYVGPVDQRIGVSDEPEGIPGSHRPAAAAWRCGRGNWPTIVDDARHSGTEQPRRVTDKWDSVLDVVPERSIRIGHAVAIAGVNHRAHAATGAVVALRIGHVWIGLRAHW